jgi:hypothetical protein
MMLKRTLFAALLLAAAFRAQALDWTDIWYNKSQPGYGYNLVQSDSCLFITFYVYGTDGKPTWFGGCLAPDGNGNWTGRIYTTTGTFFGAPWDPDSWIVMDDGSSSATFTPSTQNNYQGTFSYTLKGVGTVTNQPIERQTLTTIAAGGHYAGGYARILSSCTDPARNVASLGYPNLAITHDGSTKVLTFVFDFHGGYTCTLTGPYEQHGQYYLINNAAYTCSDGLNTTAQVTEIKVTGLGIEGRVRAVNGGAATNFIGAGCTENANFGTVFYAQ